MNPRTWRLSIAAGMAIAALSAAGSHQTIPLRVLTTDATTAPGVATYDATVREVRGGILLNDPSAYRLLLVDSSMRHARILADNDTARFEYGNYPGGILPYAGDSSVFVRTNDTFVVIDGHGAFVRASASPVPWDAQCLTNTAEYGFAGFDLQGRLIYRGQRPVIRRLPVRPAADGKIVVTERPDSAPIVRIDMHGGRTDTIAMVQVPREKDATVRQGKGMAGQTITSPVAAADAWALMPDGSVVIVRNRDYHADWVNADGTHAASARMPFAWRGITLVEKHAIIDSTVRVNAAQDSLRRKRNPNLIPFMTVEPGELPDSFPAMSAGSARADREGNLWILNEHPVGMVAGAVYDVMNRKGELIERVRLRAGQQSIAGFGKNGTVYVLNSHPTGLAIERAHVVR